MHFPHLMISRSITLRHKIWRTWKINCLSKNNQKLKQVDVAVSCFIQNQSCVLKRIILKIKNNRSRESGFSIYLLGIQISEGRDLKWNISLNIKNKSKVTCKVHKLVHITVITPSLAIRRLHTYNNVKIA